MIKNLYDRISYIPANDSPLSADVAIIKGDNKTYIFDVGNGDTYVNEINSIKNEKVIIISHFHPDHMGNLSSFPNSSCYVGNNTYKHTKRGNIVDKDLYIDDGLKLHIFPLPSSHAKGCLGLEINEELVFVGDAIGPAIRSDGLRYNAQLLFEEIKVFENLKATTIIQSHKMEQPESKDIVLQKLKDIFSKREEQNPYIDIGGRND